MIFVRTLAIDYGLRRVGLAMSDEGGKFATPLEVVTVNNPQQAAEAVEAVVRKEAVKKLVVGLPLNMDGSIGPAARQTAAWARALGEKVSIPVMFVDERLSSFEAEQRINEMKRSGMKLT